MAKTTIPHRPTVLCILDGWGWREEEAFNAVRLGRTPVFDRLWETRPHAFLEASEENVGLPSGQIGNSEVGHMNIGAGRVVLQDLPMIDRAVADGSMSRAEALGAHIAALRASGGTCHLMGLVSPGGVHAHQDHIAALARAVARAGVPVAVHIFTDGRDTPPRDAARTLPAFLDALDPGAGTAPVSVATVVGRYWAMDRDKRWERTARAYAAIVEAEGERTAPDAPTAIRLAYEAGEGDEFVAPTVIEGYRGMAAGDGVLFANFRADRARQILTALLDPAFDGFAHRPVPLADACGLVEYSEDLAAHMRTIFPPKSVEHSLGEVVAGRGLRQLRIAETEKYPHVTFFFNGGEERRFPGEDRILVPSPKVATYDLQPEMSAPEVTDRLVEAIEGGTYDFIVVNYANPDMVGHTGSLPAAIKAVETVDACLGRVLDAVERQGGVMLVTADHGNCETMQDPVSGEPHTAHTLNRVPLILVGEVAGVTGLRDGKLADLAPTLLDLMGLDRPAEMDGRVLLERRGALRAAG